MFVYSSLLGVIDDSQATKRRAAGGAGSHIVSSVLPIGRLGVQPHGCALL
jgi:hypothetical protein